MRMIPRSGLRIHQHMITALSTTPICILQAKGADMLNLYFILG